jgi:hypothetical protein
VKPKYLFLLKFIGISLFLFIFGHTILDVYSSVLRYLISFFNPRYHVPPDIVSFIYSSSITIIAFVALILSTPGVPVGKKASFIFIGMSVFMLMDFYGVQHIIFPHEKPPLDEESLVRELYLSGKWILPFLIWIIMSYSYFGESPSVAHKISDGSDKGQSPAK